MTDHAAASLAALNVSLLEAIRGGSAESLSQLADMAGVAVNNLNRKLASLLEAGLIAPAGAATHEVILTEAGRRGLAAMDVWRGQLNTIEPDAEGVVFLPCDQIDPWALNPRTQFDPASIEDMAQSIADKGVLQPITVRPAPGRAVRYEVIIGERRRRGARLAVERGWVAGDFLVPCQIRDFSDDEALDVAGVENLQRHDLHWMDEAKFYLRLAERGRSGPAIARLAGESVSKRKIQDYCKIARELPPADQARAYLPEGHKDRLLYVQARDLVGEKKEKPALELSPRLALTLLEIVDAASGGAIEPLAKALSATLHAAPSGGPIHQLQDRKLLACGFDAGRMVARVPVTDELLRWLAQLGYPADPAEALRTARAKALGDLQAAPLPPHEYATPELNPPTPATSPISAEMAGGGPPAEERVVEGASPTSDPTPVIPADPQGRSGTDLETPAYLQRLAGVPSSSSPVAQTTGEVARPQAVTEGASSPAPAPAPAPDLDALPPMLAIVLVEAAHRIGVAGVERGPGTWGAPILADYYKDARGQQLVMKRLLAFLPMGHTTLVTVTKAGRDWLWQEACLTDDAGRPIVDDHQLERQQRLLGCPPPAGRLYATPWLNPPAPPTSPISAEMAGGGPSAKEPMVEGASPAPMPPDPLIPAQAGTQAEPAADPAETLATLRHHVATLAAALRQADRLLAKLKTASKPNLGEIDQVRNWIATALTSAGQAAAEDA